MTETSGLDQPLGILIVDDHALFRRGLREVIDEEVDMRVVGEAADGEQAIRSARELRHQGLDLVLLDVDLPGLDGISTLRRIRAEVPELPIIMLTVSTLDRDLFEAGRAGAIGFLSKSLTPNALIGALRSFHREGALPMSPAMATKLLTHFQHAVAEYTPRAQAERGAENAETSLTARETEVLQLIATGARDREVAEHLVLTESTVKKHVQNNLRKLHARSRTEAVVRFWRRGR